MTLLVLYEELASYFIACISEFARQYNCEVHIIRKRVSSEAPFEFNLGGIRVYDRENYGDAELLELAAKIKPDAVLCGGWSSRIYLRIVASFKKKIPLIVGFDNQWNGSLRQRLAALAAPFYITDKFNRCFVPGPQQKQFALKMGFREDAIATGAYSCDHSFFNSQYLSFEKAKKSSFPRRFLYVGRYVEHKGIKDLWTAFIELQEETPRDWELWCLGTGELSPVSHEKIKHFGFVQPAGLPEYAGNTGVFILPSHFEPWGVVVHEFAAAGFPLICSDQVGAAVTFVEPGDNGYIYPSGKVSDLKKVMTRIMDMSDEELNRMADSSTKKAKTITPTIWAASLMKLIQQN